MADGERTLPFAPVPHDVRRVLAEAVALCRGLLPDGADVLAGNIQIVLAEALNNVAEHAFAGLPPIQAQVGAYRTGDALTVEIADRGRPLPARLLMPPKSPRLDGALADLPEGGFGWILIHELTSAISYTRIRGENRLRLRFDIATAA